MIEENEREKEFEKKVDDLLSKSAEVEYPPQLHQRAMFVWNESVQLEKPINRFAWLGYAASVVCATFIAVFVFTDSTPNMVTTQVAVNKPKSNFVANTSIASSVSNKSITEEVSDTPKNSVNSAMIATNMTQDELEDVSDEDVGEFYEKLKKYRETNSSRKSASVIYMPAAATARYSSDDR